MIKPKLNKARNSFGTYRTGEDRWAVNLKRVAEQLSSLSNIPKHFNDTRAAEVSLLAVHYLALLKFYEENQKSKS